MINLEHIPNEEKTLELCLKAIKEDSYSIKDIPERFQTPEIIEEIFKADDGYSFQFIKNKTLELCERAVKQFGGYILRFIDNQTPELCLTAIKHDPWGIRNVKKEFLTVELMELAINLDPKAFCFLTAEQQTTEIIEYTFNKTKDKEILQYFDKSKIPDYIKYYLDINNI